MKAHCLPSDEASSAGSDDELPLKMIRLDSPEQHKQFKRMKNNVWQSVIYESKLEDAFKCTDLNETNLVSVERSTESYAFDGKEIEPGFIDPYRFQSKAGRKRLRGRNFPPLIYDCSIPRDHFGVNFDSSAKKVTKAITNFLREERDDLVDKVVKTLGSKQALELCYLTEDIEKLGGLSTMDGTRRRTAGGVFFFLVRSSGTVSEEDKRIIFRENAIAKTRKKRLRRELRRQEKAREVAFTPNTTESERSIEEENKDETADIANIPSPGVYVE